MVGQSSRIYVHSTPTSPASGTVVEFNNAPPRQPFRLSALWVTCLLAVSVALVSALPIFVISMVHTERLGTDLLAEVAEQQFRVLESSVQFALDEADYWMDFIDGWLRHQALPLTGKALEIPLRNVMLPWLDTVAKRVGGYCTILPASYSANGSWSYCAERKDFSNQRQLYWMNVPSGAMMVEYRVDRYFNLLESVSTWPTYPYDKEYMFSWKDRQMQWQEPWLWVDNTYPDGSVYNFTEVGQYRFVRPTANSSALIFVWMQDVDWAKLLRQSLAKAQLQVDASATAFLFSNKGTLITATCGITNKDSKLIQASDSDCAVVRQTYGLLSTRDFLTTGDAFFKGELGGSNYFVGLQRIVTSRGDNTPYYLALSYPFSAVDQPLRWTLTLLIIVSVACLCSVVLLASIFASQLIAAPLQQLAVDMYRCVELDISSTIKHRPTRISELFSILDSFLKMKASLETVTKFTPLEVIQRSLKEGSRIGMCMIPTRASVLFLDVVNFTALTESTETGQLVLSIGQFFEELSSIIVQLCGLIDKYIGDCIMAIWNTPEPVPDHQYWACRAALACAEWMDKGQSSAHLQLKGRIGLEAGPVYAGVFGCRHRMNYTVVGDVVNIASRLEQLHKHHRSTILIGPQIYQAVKDRVITRQLDPVQLKGKATELVPYELHGLVPTEPCLSTQSSTASLLEH